MTACICPRFSDTDGYRIADLTCPVHGVSGTDPGDGPWEEEPEPEHVPSPSVAIIHLGCGGIAFRIDHVPSRNEPMLSASVVWPSGVKDGDDVVCAECGAGCAPGDLIPEGYTWAE